MVSWQDLLANLPLSSGSTSSISSSLPHGLSSRSRTSSTVHASFSQMTLLEAYPPAPPESLLFTQSPTTPGDLTTASSSPLPPSYTPPVDVDSFYPSIEKTSSWSAEQICGVVVVALIVPFILASNLLVIVSVAKFKRLQIPTNYFIVSLAAVDVFVALVTPFVIAVEVLPGQVSDLVLCLAPNRILMTACGVSLLTLAAIAYDRHTALVSPLKYVSVMTMRRIVLLVVLTWLYSASIVWAPLPLGWYSDPNIPRAWGESLHTGDEGASAASALDSAAEVSRHTQQQHCSFKLLHDNAHILFLSAIFGPACAAITVCYFRIYTVARHHARAIAAVESSVHHNLRMRFIMKDAKYAKTLALVIGVFLALWLPYLLCLLAEVLTEVHVSAWLWNYLTLLAVLNSGLNPWIYAYKNNEFRVAFRKIFKACCSARFGILRRFSKDSRRPSAMSEANTTTTNTLTTTNNNTITSVSTLPRTRSGPNPTGRLSDVSCVLTIGTDERSDAVGLDDSRVCPAPETAISSTIPSITCVSHCDKLFQRRTSIAGEKCTSTLVSSDSRAFIADLLSLYLHQSVLQVQDSIAGEEIEVIHADGHSDHSHDSLDTVTTHDSEMAVDRSC